MNPKAKNPPPSASITALGYARVSTREQAEEGISLEVQEKMLNDYCRMRGLTLANILVDRGVSAGKPLGKRPAGAQLLQRVAAGEAVAVVGLKLDRLFRNAIDCLQVVQTWDSHGVALHLVNQGGASINTRTAMGRFMLTVMAGVAEMERLLISERTKDAFDLKRSKGEHLGVVPYGYQKRLGGKVLEPCPNEQQIIAHIQHLREDGLSYAKVAKRLNEEGIPARGKQWYKTTLIRLLQRVANPSWRPELSV